MTSLQAANPTANLALAPVANRERENYNKGVLTGLGIAEVVLGSLMIVTSCLSLGFANIIQYRSSYSYVFFSPGINVGEGIWCGIWILIAGALGIARERKQPTACLIKCQLGFSIVGAIFSLVLLAMGIVAAIRSISPIQIALLNSTFIGSLTTLILCIISAVFCCKRSSVFGVEICCGYFNTEKVIMTSPPAANPTLVLSPVQVANRERGNYNKGVLTSLGIAEFVLGSLMIAISSVSLSYPDRHQYYSSNLYVVYYSGFSIGEGIWCGIWILIAGALGIARERKQLTACLIKCQLGFSIVGAIFSLVLLVMGIVAAIGFNGQMLFFIEDSTVVGSLTTLILCIISAVFCCKQTSTFGVEICCGSCNTEKPATSFGGGQLMHMSSIQNCQQVRQQGVVQTYPAVISGQPGVYPGNIVILAQPCVAVSHLPGLATQQAHSSTSEIRSEIERKHQEPMGFDDDAFTSEEVDTHRSDTQNH